MRFPFFEVVCQHNLGPLCCGHEIRLGGPRSLTGVQVFHLPQLSLPGQVALQNLRGTRAPLQGPGARVPSVSLILHLPTYHMGE